MFNYSQPEGELKSDAQVQGPIIGVGCAAGGLEALKAFFIHIPDDCGMTFVVIQQQAPDHNSSLAEILSTVTHIPVRELSAPTEAQVNTVYVARPGSAVALRNGTHLFLSEVGAHRFPIDYFFRSLAGNLQYNAVGVLLSGAGTDGTVGLQAVKRCGGLTLAQSPETARFDSMPQAAISAGVVDHAVTPEEMAGKIVGYFAFRAQNVSEGGSEDELVAALPAIFQILQNTLGHDFSSYKQSTLIRRIYRRMQMLRLKPAEAYAEVLGKQPQEAEALFRDLIIGVTEFFRDTEVFNQLAKHVIPKLFQQLDASGTLRLWVAGCATGEEAYSLAILLSEHMTSTGESHPVQIFATDIDGEAIDIARRGFFKDEIKSQVSKERLSKFFLEREGGFQILPEIREMCVFSVHNIIQDPPFSRMDFISCRNVLIYFDAALQKKVVPLFHFALNQQGFLLLGPAESLGTNAELFSSVEKRLRIFQVKRSQTGNSPRLPRTDMTRLIRVVGDTSLKVKLARERDARDLHEQALLDWYVPPSILLDNQGEVLHFARQTASFLQPPVGSPSNNIFDIVKDDLKFVLRAALTQARKDDQEVIRKHISVGDPGLRITLIVRPLKAVANGNERFLVIFREEETPLDYEHLPSSPKSEEAEAVHQLESELRLTKQWLQTTVEELENSNEELKSSNEELISINEEYQSANEALQTSKEELQSLNEELETVNVELSKKLDELDQANTDMRGLFASSAIATIFLDGDLRIKKFTSAASQLFSLIDTDVGRSLSDITARFDTAKIIESINRAVDGQAVPDIEIDSPDRMASYVCRITPTYGSSPKPVGIVLNVIDITELKMAQAALKAEGDRKDEFLAILGHELRNPLAPLTLGLATLRRNRAPSQEAREEFYNIFERQLSQLTRIVDDLLDVSRISRGHILLQKEPLLLSELLPLTISDFNSIFSAKKIELTTSVAADIWIEGDRTRIRQIIANLLGNAAKFTPSGGKVHVSLSSDQTEAFLSVEDSGLGMDSQTLNKLFKPLSQGPSTIDRKGAGLGLGLALVKGLAELHQGGAAVASRGIGLGSTLTVTLPLTNSRGVTPVEPEIRTIAPRRIVVIEDNVDAARSLEMTLLEQGHTVWVAYSGVPGIDLIEQHQPDIVICDVGLPGALDGYEIARTIHLMQLKNRPLLVAATGYGQESDKHKAFDAGFDIHLTKPIEMEDIQTVFAKR